LRCWGDDTCDELGNNMTNHLAYTPVTVLGISMPVVSVSVGQFEACAILMNGTVTCWGCTDHGQLGSGTPTAMSMQPTPVSNLSGATAIASGGSFSCAIVAGGAVKCWGDNGFGELGNGVPGDSNVPVTASGVSGAVSISGGGGHVCVIVAGGAVSCWGANSDGQLGTGPAGEPIATSTPIANLTGVTGIAAGGSHTCALFGDGTVSCWGDNTSGQIGDGSTSGGLTLVPKKAAGITDAVALALGAQHTCALSRNGTIHCWGNNEQGQVGNGSMFANVYQAGDAVTGIANATALVSGSYHACALLPDGTVACWGSGHAIGDGAAHAAYDAFTPVTVLAVVPGQ
jgi:alpha-tubulin suppressor-like RCC1 family protein